MTKRYLRRVLSSIVLLITISAFTISPFTTTFLTDEHLDQDYLGVQLEDHPEWEEIIRTAFQSVGISEFYFNKDMGEHILKYPHMSSAMGVDKAKDWVVGFMISPEQYVQPYTDADPRTYENTTFHSYPVTITTYMNIYNDPFTKNFEWSMNGLFYYASVVFVENISSSDLLYIAEALYSAATGSAPSAPASPPSDPAPPSPPSGMCADVNCKNNYCKDDGSKFLYDCACDETDGKCYCQSDKCSVGCDAEQGGCLPQASSDGKCAGVVCNMDYCADDGKTRFYECECSEDDGECYCWTEVCELGCDAALGACVVEELPIDLCEGVACITQYCGEDGLTLNYDCECNSTTGKCDCQTETCETGCDSTAVACGKDLCADVECPDKCENNVSSVGGTCNLATGECLYVDINDCGLAGCEDTGVLCKRQFDLAVKKVTVLQSVEGGTMIGNKPTAVVAAFDWENLLKDANASVTLFIDGKPFSTIRQTVKAEDAYTKSEKYFSKDVAIFHIPANYIQSGMHKFLVEAVLMDEDLVDEDLSNNFKTVSGEFITSTGISLMFAAHPSITEGQIWSFINKARPFLLNIFPVTGVYIKPPFYPLSSTGPKKDQIAELMAIHEIHNATLGQYVRFSVGLFKDGHFGAGVNGFSYWWAKRSVMVGDGSTNEYAHQALPHEIAGQWLADEYTKSDIGKPLPKNIYIYDGQKKKLENLEYSLSGNINLMGLAGEVSNLWVNKETWDALASQFGSRLTGFNPGLVLARPLPVQESSGSGYLLTGTISAGDQVIVKTLLPFENIPFEKEDEGEYWVHVYNGRGSLDGKYPLPVEVSLDDPAGSPFVVSVPADITDTGELRIVHDEQTIWKSSASAADPTVTIVTPAGSSPLSGTVDITWQAEDADGDELIYTLLYSIDDGETWVPIAVRLEEPKYKLDLDRLPGGSACRLRVIASDGWNATRADTPDAFAVADKAAVLEIDAPQDGEQIDYHAQLDLSAYAYDKETGWIDGENITWQSSVDGQLGMGNYLTFDDLSSGEHTITALLDGPSGQKMQASVAITIADPPKPSGLDDMTLYTIQSGIAVVLVIGAVVLLVIMKRKGKKRMVIFAVVLLVLFIAFLLLSLLMVVEAPLYTPPSGRRPETVEITQVQQPSLSITSDPQDDSMPSADGELVYGPSVTYNGTTLMPSIAGSINPETIPSSLETNPYWGLPEHDQFMFNGYPVENDIHEPVIRIFPTDTYRAGFEEAEQVITALEQLLADRPAVPGDNLPFLPIWNAGPLGTAKIKYLDFQSGGGLRYITQYGQAFWPFYNKGMFYTYQGLTADGRFYISAILPLAHGVLDEYDDFQPADDFHTNAAALIVDQVDLLNTQAESSFSPSIEELDAMMQSITIETEGVG